MRRDDLAGTMPTLMDALARRVPHGLGKGAVWRLNGRAELEEILLRGSGYAVERGHGGQRDLDRCEDFGSVADADPAGVSERALDRGLEQVGSLGSGNHFLEVQAVDAIYDDARADAFGLRLGQVTVMIHCGSRGLGHQICTDHVKIMERSMGRFGITVPDRQLACAPVDSEEGRAYLGAMAAAANYGRANRHLLAEATRVAFAEATGQSDLDLVYDISHNLAKIEEHVVDGQKRTVCVHRKGATRALPPGHADLPPDLVAVGQPVLVPGSMGTASYVLGGVEGGGAFYSTCHGAGRAMSRTQARKKVHGNQLRKELEQKGITVRAASAKGLAEEAPFSYKDVDAVVLACENAGLATRVARLVPLGVVKG